MVWGHFRKCGDVTECSSTLHASSELTSSEALEELRYLFFKVKEFLDLIYVYFHELYPNCPATDHRSKGTVE